MGQDDSNTHRPSSLFERLTQGDDPLFSQIDRNAKTLLQSALSRLDVVSREEFDAQTAVLQRTRERLEAHDVTNDALNFPEVSESCMQQHQYENTENSLEIRSLFEATTKLVTIMIREDYIKMMQS